METQSSWKPGHPEFAPFNVGDLVKKETHRPGNLLTNKFQRRYDGPLTVLRVNNNGVTYLVQSEEGQERRVHHSQLRPWKKPPAYLLRACRRVRELSGTDTGSSQRSSSAEDSCLQPSGTSPALTPADQRPSGRTSAGVQETIRWVSPPPSRGISSTSCTRSSQSADAATEMSPKAPAASSSSSSLRSESTRRVSEAATGTSPVATRTSEQQTSPGLRGALKVATRTSEQQTSPGLRGSLKVRFDVPPSGRPQRNRRPPVKFGDYVMY